MTKNSPFGYFRKNLDILEFQDNSFILVRYIRLVLFGKINKMKVSMQQSKISYCK